MSDLLFNRLLLSFINVKNRLESLLNLCSINEYRLDIKEIQIYIRSVSSLIDNLQYEFKINDNLKLFSNRSLCKNGWTWKKIQQLNNEEQFFNLELLALLRLQILATCFNKFDKQKFRKQTTSSNIMMKLIEEFAILSRKSSNLKKIHFQNVFICPILICLVIEYFPHCLETIIFDYQQDNNYKNFDFILCLLGNENLKLRSLTASYQLGITNFGILQLVKNLNILVELNLVNINAINDQSIKILCDKHYVYLETLRIDGAQLTDRALDFIAQCHQLRKLMIEFCTNMTDANFSIFQNFHKLEQLYLSTLNNISSKSFQLLFNKNCTFKYLHSLTLGECHMIDDNCVRLIVQCCPHLIDLTCSSAYGITDEGFNEIVTHCNQLRYFTLTGCHQIYGEILLDVPEKYLKSIEYLNLDKCNKIDDIILIELFQRKKFISIVNSYGSLIEL
ncbi:unnamed protein product [Rotaria sp. Silwood1]|nr:unnamed protein product [Rotaria sp. Silwood1]CAF4553641.1 unnamed protein product [Rotaria sp. Silwood1]